MNKLIQSILALISLLSCMETNASAQGFLNLSFEEAVFYVPPTAPGVYGGSIDPALAFRHWTIGNSRYTNGGTFVLYNARTIDSPMVGLIGPSFPNALSLTPLQGSYSALLQEASINSFFGRPTLSQIGTVPADARSINFLGVISDGAVSLGGTELPLIDVGNGRWAADVTAFAGQQVELSFTTLPRPDGYGRIFYVDDIRFSSTVVPEPSCFALITIAIIILAFFGRCRTEK